jgi:phosphatidylglycerophosphatase C
VSTDPSPAAPRRIAAFDFDGTLSKRDTLIPFLSLAAGRARFASACARLGLLGARGRIAVRDRDAVKVELLRLLFTGRSEDELRHLGELYARDLAANELRPEVLRRLEQHLEAGHETAFVSASLVYYLEPLAELLDVHRVIAVEPAVVDGRLTGSLTHPNVRAHQKAHRLRLWLDQPDSGPLQGVEVWAYGNSSGDHALLELADHSYWMGSQRKLPPGVEAFRSAIDPF